MSLLEVAIVFLFKVSFDSSFYYRINIINHIKTISIFFDQNTNIFFFIHWSVKPRGLARGYKRLAQATNAVFVVVVECIV